MAKIKSTKKFLKGPEGDAEFIQEINVNAKGEFWCVLPQWWVSILGYSEIATPTLRELEAEWDRARYEYETARTDVVKVVLFRFQFKGLEATNPRTGKLEVFNEISFTNGLALSFVAVVAIETTVYHPDNSQSVVYEVVPSSIHIRAQDRQLFRNKTRRLDTERVLWSPEAEAFFARMGGSMLDLMERLYRMRELLEFSKAIEAGINPLLPKRASA